MLSKYIQYFLDENNLEIGEEFMLTNENGRHIHPDKTFFFNGNPTSSRDILISKADKFFECATNRVFKIIPTIEGDKE